ncbi:MAG: aspartate kinase, partial [Candidatus Levybacteria bacterium]|nr:aspartate kinase [Candidatus Levybacteria bacterium]
DTSLQKRKKILKEIEQIHLDLMRSYWGNDISDMHIYLAKCLQEVGNILRRKEPIKAISDQIVSYGEILSSYIISKALETVGMKSQQIIATELIVTDSNFTNAEFLPDVTTRQTREVLLPIVKKGIVPVVTGFIGATKDRKTTTLGRGGSDYSAAILGFSLSASEIQIWTDVDGIFTADPRVVPLATQLHQITYREASELAAFGAKVLHPRTIRPAITAGIPVRVLNTLNPESSGTIITTADQKYQRVVAIAAQKRVKLVNLYSTEMLHSRGFLVRIFNVFAKHTISVDLVSVSEVSVSVTLDNSEHMTKAVEELSEFTNVTTREVGIVSLIGEGIVGMPHIMRNIFFVLDIARVPVHMISQGASAINISLAIDTDEVDAAVRLLHDSVLLGDSPHERSFL